MIDHAPYIHAVARHLDEAGFHVLSTRTDVGGPSTGWIVLERQDDWRDRRWYGNGNADLLWMCGWSLKRAGLVVPLNIWPLASPAAVAKEIGHWVGRKPRPVSGAVLDEPNVKPGTPEYYEVLAGYVRQQADSQPDR